MKRICKNCIHLSKSNKCLKHDLEIKDIDRGMGCFDDGNSKMYQSREFCRDFNCNIQNIIDDPKRSNKQAKEYCHEVCLAYKFHKWIKENNYQIRKVK